MKEALDFCGYSQLKGWRLLLSSALPCTIVILPLGNWRTAVTRSTIQSSKLARSSSLNTGSDILGLIPGLLPSTLKLTEMGSYVHGYMRYTGGAAGIVQLTPKLLSTATQRGR